MIRVSSFAGEVPRLIPRLLAENYAQIAENVRVERGDLLPIRASRFEQRLDAAAKTIYKHGDTWLSFDEVVSVVPAPIAENRVYIFGDGAPQLLVDNTLFPLAIPVPENALYAETVNPGGVNKDNSFVVLYSFTWVTAYGEESMPADLSNQVTVDTSSSVTLRNFPPKPAGRNIDRLRIYRSQTSTSGDTMLYFVSEQAAPDYEGYTYTDIIRINASAELLPSGDYNPPPEKLTGAIALPNGMMAAFVGKKLYFSEPWIPHAWPEKYILTVDFDIIGLSAFGSSLAILTKGHPYVAQGTHPENMVMERLRVNLPCVTARGIVDLGYAVAYPSTVGLVTISSSGAQIASDALFTAEQWRLMQPESFIAAQFAGRYIFASRYLNESGNEMQGLLGIDMTGATPFVVRMIESCDALYFEIGSGILHMLQNGTDIYEYDALSQNTTEYRWRSKKFVLNTLTAFGCVLVEGGTQLTKAELDAIEKEREETREENQTIIDRMVSGGPVASERIAALRIAGSRITPIYGGSGGSGSGGGSGGYTDLPSNLEPTFEVSIYGDGKLVFSGQKLNAIMRIPAKRLYRTWEIEVKSNQSITGISLAYSPSEIAEAG
jgi:hypothetical protein